MKRYKDITGRRFGRLYVIEYVGNDKHNNALWLCKCDCGNEIIVRGVCLRRGGTRSCGCLRNELSLARVSGEKCPLARPDVVAKRTGDLSPSKRPEARKKMSERLGEKSPNWQGGISFGKYCPKWTKELRERIRAFFNYECIICGKTTKENGRALSCHHVEYNKQACCDGQIIYFVVLCMNCHMKTNFNREYWKNVLHRIIDEIYEGKSYYTKEEYKNKEYLNG
jgi:hypothetical protein